MPLLFAALIIVLITVVLFYLDKRTKFGALPSFFKQTIFGICFGLAAAFATEIGSFNLFGAAVNCRDAAPITAGLLFGPWSGILAGIIGAIDRFFIATPIFGIGAYTQVACSIATLFAGIFSAIFKVTVFKKHRPMVIHAFVFVLVTEVFHMCMVPLTHLDDIENATMVVYNTFMYLFMANLLAVLLAFAITSIMNQRFKGLKLKEMFSKRDLFFEQDLFYSFQFWLLLILFICFGSTIVVVAASQEINSTLTTEKTYQNELNALKDAISVDSERYQTTIEIMGTEYTRDWTAGETIIYQLVDHEGRVVGDDGTAKDFNQTTNGRDENTLYYSNVDGTVYYIMYSNFNNYKVILAITEKYEMFTPHFITMITTFILILIFGVLMFLVFRLLRRMVGDNLEQLDESLEKLASGKFDEQLEDSSLSQFSDLSQKINTTVSTLKDEIEREANKYNTEFEMAHEIQMSALPCVFPAFPEHPEIDVYARYRSAREVGGDFYDYYHVGKNKICFVIADVSGKGVPAAMFMMRAKSSLMMFARSSQDPAKALTMTNKYLCENNIADMFVTAWVGILDLSSGQMTYASAGHNPPIILDSKTGKATMLESSVSLVLGGLPEVKYKNSETKLNKGQVLFLYTDGVSEANDIEGKLYGEPRLIKDLEKIASKSVKEICDATIDNVDKFAGKAEQFDDITVLSVKLI